MDTEDWSSHDVPSDSAANLHFSDSDEEPEEDGEHTGDYSHYSQQIDDLFDEGEHEEKNGDDEHGSKSDDEEEGFVYSGVDASDPSVSYQDQLRDVLDQDDPEESLDGLRELQVSVDEHEPLVSTNMMHERARTESETGTL
jgi:hypothetical protein